MNKEFIPKYLEQDMIDLGMIYKVLASKKYNGVPVNGTVEEWTVGILYSTAFRWFREKYSYHHTIQLNKKYVGIAYSSVVNFSIDEFDTYEEAELACLKKLIEIAKNK